ncbi:PREDICTED: venom allergen 5 2-like [Vollenhovia emeryi]|uniref:venom allergen 5 2-like n=1 Tax=Vollenhovia emeryi TaxID=411798 RepID=UPI0005F52C62|nr:PREDICTED: venom allergen 5 2-like [Vollenhovia emeryi]
MTFRAAPITGDVNVNAVEGHARSDCEGADCIDVENDTLDEEDIETVLDSHNLYRVLVANGREYRGNPGPQPAARTMMELIWDDELAVIARRWALQCKLFEKDQCRDVGK